jgi:hypothetical protein
MSLKITCPNCKKAMNVRTSDRPTETTVRAELYCTHCAGVKAKFIGELLDVKYAHYSAQKPDTAVE